MVLTRCRRRSGAGGLCILARIAATTSSMKAGLLVLGEPERELPVGDRVGQRISTIRLADVHVEFREQGGNRGSESAFVIGGASWPRWSRASIAVRDGWSR